MRGGRQEILTATTHSTDNDAPGRTIQTGQFFTSASPHKREQSGVALSRVVREVLKSRAYGCHTDGSTYREDPRCTTR